MRAFIIRPFGTKPDLGGKDIDFEHVEEELIAPALKQLDIEGRTTGEITEAGNIRLDMFQRLVTADLVIADLSIHNANVFYELGIRHGLRDKRTFLIRCDADQYPFDLQTDRYLVYDRNKPEASLKALIDGLRRTIDSDRRDSPVYLLLPDLKPQDPSGLLIVPPDFDEDVETAGAEREYGDLNLLASEVKGFDWEVPGLRVVGRKQFELKANEGARVTWEAVREIDPWDTEANLLLGTIYERLSDLTRSDQAVQRVLERGQPDRAQRAEAYALLARNAKRRWKAEWFNSPDERKRRALALGSGFLLKCCDGYERAYEQDLNHFYSGLNAAAMLSVVLQLGAALPDAWEAKWDTAVAAQTQLTKAQERYGQLVASVQLSFEAERRRLERENREDIWLEISRADLRSLTSNSPERVAQGYRDALAGANDFHRDAAGNQLAIYERLGVHAENVRAALEVVGSRGKTHANPKPPRVILFTGHRVDSPGRKVPRFPADKEDTARKAIGEKVVAEQKLVDGEAVIGIAGGASGGDILFHEVCGELAIPTQLYLAIPREPYVAESVASAGNVWVERFNRLFPKVKVRARTSFELPRWLRKKPEYGVWQRNNLWTLHNALAQGGANVTLIALWNGQGGDGPGGTQDMVEQAQQRGAKVVIVDTKVLFGL